MDNAVAGISGRIARRSAREISGLAESCVLGNLVGCAFHGDLYFLRAELEIYLHRFLDWVRRNAECEFDNTRTVLGHGLGVRYGAGLREYGRGKFDAA